MGVPTRVQLIRRKCDKDQRHVNLPFAVAQAMDFEKGGEWFVEDRATLVLKRRPMPPSPLRKRPAESSTSTASSGRRRPGA